MENGVGKDTFRKAAEFLSKQKYLNSEGVIKAAFVFTATNDKHKKPIVVRDDNLDARRINYRNSWNVIDWEAWIRSLFLSDPSYQGFDKITSIAIEFKDIDETVILKTTNLEKFEFLSTKLDVSLFDSLDDKTSCYSQAREIAKTKQQEMQTAFSYTEFDNPDLEFDV